MAMSGSVVALLSHVQAHSFCHPLGEWSEFSGSRMPFMTTGKPSFERP